MSDKRARAAAAALVILFLALTVAGSSRQSVTSDEPAHLVAGYSYLRLKDYRLNPEHPPLMKKLAALPLLLLPLWPDSFEIPSGDDAGAGRLTARRVLAEGWALAAENIDFQWPLAWAFLYGMRDGTLSRLGVEGAMSAPAEALYEKGDFQNDADLILFMGRLVPALAGALLAVLVFLWARELFGPAGGILSLALFCFDPNFIAHSGLVTTDVSLTLFVFGSVYFLWRHERRPSPSGFFLVALFTALTFASKFSAVLLPPIFIATALLSYLLRKGKLLPAGEGGGSSPPSSGPWSFAVLMAVSLLAGYLMIWAVYGFRHSAARDPRRAAAVERMLTGDAGSDGRLPLEYVVKENAALADLLRKWPAGDYPGGLPTLEKAASRTPPGFDGKLLLWANEHRLLPEAYLYGFAHVRNRSMARVSYLRGRHSMVGFRSYLLWAFLLKTPLVTIALIAAALFFSLCDKGAWRRYLPYLLVPILVYGSFAIKSRLSIGHRHLFPVYPFLYVLCGGLTVPWKRWSGKARRLSGGGLLAAVAFSAFFVLAPPWRPAFVYPHFLSYFNELAGGPRKGHESLVDSNIDWGQGLKELRRWLDERGIEEPVNLCYFGNADPRYHGIPFVNMPGGYRYAPPGEFSSARRPGYLAISATALHGAYFTPAGRAAWADFLRGATFVDTVGHSLFVYYLDEKK